jgi:peroxiredoxin
MQSLVGVGDRLENVTLSDVEGTPVEVASLLDRPLVIPLVRYYGCMPCKAFLHDLAEVRGELEAAGLGIVGVGGAADYQARDLMNNGIDFPLLLDSGHTLYEALDVRRIHWWMLLRPMTWRKYLRAASRARQGRITGHPLQAPGLAIVDVDRTIRFLHRGQTLGDYPSTSRIVSAARELAASPRAD